MTCLSQGATTQVVTLTLNLVVTLNTCFWLIKVQIVIAKRKQTVCGWINLIVGLFIYMYFTGQYFIDLWASQWTLKSLILPALVEVLWGPWEIFHLWAEYFSCNINTCHQMQNQSRNHNYIGLEVDMVCCLNLPPSTVAPFFFFKCMANFKYSWISHHLPGGCIR